MAKLCVPDVVKDLHVKVFNMLARINETRKVVWHETCKCVCRLTSAIATISKNGMKISAYASVKKI